MKKKRKDIRNYLLEHKRISEIGSAYAHFLIISETLNLIEQGYIKDNNGKQIVRCSSANRDKMDNGYFLPIFEFLGYSVRMVFANDIFLTIYSVSFKDNLGRDVHWSTEDLKKLMLYSLANWKPSNLLFWLNMALVKENER